jgi:hypothetical protein
MTVQRFKYPQNLRPLVGKPFLRLLGFYLQQLGHVDAGKSFEVSSQGLQIIDVVIDDRRGIALDAAGGNGLKCADAIITAAREGRAIANLYQVSKMKVTASIFNLVVGCGFSYIE